MNIDVMVPESDGNIVGNKAKRWISKGVFQENKHAEFSERNEHFLPHDTHMYI